MLAHEHSLEPHIESKELPENGQNIAEIPMEEIIIIVEEIGQLPIPFINLETQELENEVCKNRF